MKTELFDTQLAHRRLMPLQGKLVTGGNVMDRTSNKEPKVKPFVHPLCGKRDESNVSKRRVNRAVKRASVSQ
jgi:hypothetical protein